MTARAEAEVEQLWRQVLDTEQARDDLAKLVRLLRTAYAKAEHAAEDAVERAERAEAEVGVLKEAVDSSVGIYAYEAERALTGQLAEALKDMMFWGDGKSREDARTALAAWERARNE